jgi:hypothetical protein
MNLLLLDCDKTNFIHLKIKNSHRWDTVIEYDKRWISNISYTNFLGLALDSALHWKTYIDQLLPKLSLACYAISVFKQIMPQETVSNGRLSSGTQVHGFKPGRSRRIFLVVKILSMPSFGREVKPFAPCRRFAAR